MLENDMLLELLGGSKRGSSAPEERRKVFERAKRAAASAIAPIVHRTPAERPGPSGGRWARRADRAFENARDRFGGARRRAVRELSQGLAESRQVLEDLERQTEFMDSSGVYDEAQTKRWARKNASELASIAQVAIAQPILQCKQASRWRDEFQALDKRTSSDLRCRIHMGKCAAVWSGGPDRNPEPGFDPASCLKSYNQCCRNKSGGECAAVDVGHLKKLVKWGVEQEADF